MLEEQRYQDVRRELSDGDEEKPGGLEDELCEDKRLGRGYGDGRDALELESESVIQSMQRRISTLSRVSISEFDFTSSAAQPYPA